MSWQGRIPDEKLIEWINLAEHNPDFISYALHSQLILELRSLNYTVQWFENLRRGGSW